MWTDVVDLRDFYASDLGQVSARVLRQNLRQFWPNTAGLEILGLGFAIPLLQPHLRDAKRVLAAMPQAMGALHWPKDGKSLTFLTDEGALPLADNSIDRVILIHAVESSDQLRGMLREVWRVMADGGRLIVVVPNRRGVWARLDLTPFGAGRPYSVGQLGRLLRDNLFTPNGQRGALYLPPMSSKLGLNWAGAWEKVGARWAPGFGGVLMMEATKQVYAVTPGTKVKGRLLMPAPQAMQRIQPSNLDFAKHKDSLGST